MATIEKIKSKYKDEWVLIEVLEKNEKNQPLKGNVLAHSKNRDDTYDAMGKTKAKHLYHLYTGEIPKKGYAVAFTVK